MESEIANNEGKKTWIETKLPPGRKAVGCKWVFKVKEDGDGQVDKFKSRMVAQGFSRYQASTSRRRMRPLVA